MNENKVYANEKLIEYFSNIWEGFRYVLTHKSEKVSLNDSEAVLKAKDVEYGNLVKDFQKFYFSTLTKIGSGKITLNKEEDKKIERQIDNLTNSAVDKLETVVRKTGHALPQKKQIVFKQAVLLNIANEMKKSFDELKFIDNSNFNFQN